MHFDVAGEMTSSLSLDTMIPVKYIIAMAVVQCWNTISVSNSLDPDLA